MNQPSTSESSPPIPTGPSANVVHRLLKERPLLFDEIQEERALLAKTATFLLLIVVLGGFYGLTMGAFGSWLQAGASAAKVPLFLVGAMVFCLPALYVFNVLLGSRMSLLQVATLLTMSTAVMTIVLGAFAPITLFCVLTGIGYDFFVFENVFCFTVAGVFGLDYLWSATRRIATARGGERDMTILAGWMVIYVLLASQLAWSMRPFIGNPEAGFEILRGTGGNFFDAMWGVLDRLLT